MVDLIVFDHSRFLDKCWKDSCSGLGESSSVLQRISQNTNCASVNWWCSREEKLHGQMNPGNAQLDWEQSLTNFFLWGFLEPLILWLVHPMRRGIIFRDFKLLSPWKIFCVGYLAAVVFPEIQYGKHWVKTLARVGWLIARRISA